MDNNESNSLILGRIPGSGSGLRKTYLESKFVSFEESIIKNYLKNGKLYYNPEIGQYSVYIDGNCIEMEILEIHQFFDYNRYDNSLRPYFSVEVIEKSILRQHLLDERMIIEEEIKGKTL